MAEVVAGVGQASTAAGLETVKAEGVTYELTAKAHGRKRKSVDVQPVLDLILVYREDVDMSAGGLHLPIGHEREVGPRYAKVIAVGPGRPSEWNAEIIPMPLVEPGDTVLLHAGGGVPWEHEGTKYFWVLPRDLIGVVT